MGLPRFDGICDALWRRMKRFILPAVLICLANFCRAENTARQVLDEINFARTSPQSYARVIADRSGGRGQSAAEREAVRFLQNAKPLPALSFSDGLAAAASLHVAEQGPRGEMGHGRMPQRVARYGTWSRCLGENIDYGRQGARGIVVALIVDERVPSRAHRKNIFNHGFSVVGVAYGSHARFGTMCVMDFAGGFADKGSPSAAPNRFAAQAARNRVRL
jgi:uncharacterized protein YkwD